MLGLEGNDAAISLLDVARIFGKAHRYLLNRKVRDGIGAFKNVHTKHALSGVRFVTYQTSQNKTEDTALLDRKAFYYIVLGFTGKDVAMIRNNYIMAFEAMRELLYSATDEQLSEARATIKGYKLMLVEEAQRADAAEEMRDTYLDSLTSISESIDAQSVYRNLKNVRVFKGLQKQGDFMEMLTLMNWRGKGSKPLATGLKHGYVVGEMVTANNRDRLQCKVTPLGIKYLTKNYVELVDKYRPELEAIAKEKAANKGLTKEQIRKNKEMIANGYAPMYPLVSDPIFH